MTSIFIFISGATLLRAARRLMRARPGVPRGATPISRRTQSSRTPSPPRVATYSPFHGERNAGVASR
jgi:hypothetical protein